MLIDGQGYLPASPIEAQNAFLNLSNSALPSEQSAQETLIRKPKPWQAGDPWQSPPWVPEIFYSQQFPFFYFPWLFLPPLLPKTAAGDQAKITQPTVPQLPVPELPAPGDSPPIEDIPVLATEPSRLSVSVQDLLPHLPKQRNMPYAEAHAMLKKLAPSAMLSHMRETKGEWYGKSFIAHINETYFLPDRHIAFVSYEGDRNNPHKPPGLVRIDIKHMPPVNTMGLSSLEGGTLEAAKTYLNLTVSNSAEIKTL